MAYKTIVVGTDGSESARRAVGRAVELAVCDEARLIVVTAFDRSDDDPDDSIPVDVRWQVTDANAAEQHAREGREVAHEAGVAEVIVQALSGDAAEKLLETAEDFNADLVVVGSVGLTGATRFLGSVANTVLHNAQCDVIVVHTHGGQ